MKKLFVLLLTLALCVSLAACGNPGEKPSSDGGDGDKVSQNDKDNNDKDGAGAVEFDYGTDYIDDHLKGDYSISYKITSKESGEEADTYTSKMMRTSEGYYVSMGEDTEMLYIKNGDKYDMYMGDSENGFEPYAGMSLTEEEIKAQTQIFLGYMSSYAQFKDSLNKTGNETVAGRSCEKYAFDYSGMGVKVKYEYCIDKETGVCMKFQVEGGTVEGSGQYTFECTEFKTSGISLPKHK